ncbi:MAG: hypothetical protein ACFFAN_09125 [Promethearchaeota archaeon]
MGKLKKFILYIASFKPILLSHHPNCTNYNKHTFKIGKYRFCIGCFIGYTTAIIGIFAISFLNLVEIIDIRYFFYISIVLMSTFILSPLNLTKFKSIKIIQKTLIGIGAAFMFWYIWTLPNSFTMNFLIFNIVFGLLLMIFNAYHGYGFFKTCKKCEYKFNWENCPGFEKVYKNFAKYNLSGMFISKNKRNED